MNALIVVAPFEASPHGMQPISRLEKS
jgi:hypothetical protein